jgi:hypothetical protein
VLEHELAGVGNRATPPCDAAGVAR